MVQYLGARLGQEAHAIAHHHTGVLVSHACQKFAVLTGLTGVAGVACSLFQSNFLSFSASYFLLYFFGCDAFLPTFVRCIKVTAMAFLKDSVPSTSQRLCSLYFLDSDRSAEILGWPWRKRFWSKNHFTGKVRRFVCRRNKIEVEISINASYSVCSRQSSLLQEQPRSCTD